MTPSASPKCARCTKLEGEVARLRLMVLAMGIGEAALRFADSVVRVGPAEIAPAPGGGDE
jgi:hypothetical protein